MLPIMVGIDFIQDLGLVMLAATAAGWICRRLGLPLLLGYISAGILLGPHTPLFALIKDTSQIHSLAQVGLVFLVFQIGQGLPLQKLKSVGLPLVLAALVIAVLVFNGSRLLGHALGWPAIYGLVLASMLMVSSTAIIGKTLRENNAVHSGYGQAALSLTALDDLVAVIMLTVLTLVHRSASMGAAALVETSLRLVAVMAAMLIIAVLLVPPLLKRLNRPTPGELRPLFLVGLLLAMAWLSSRNGFPAAIGAFLLGSVIASTGHQAGIDRSLGGLCEVFGALFFVAVGMLLDLKLLGTIWPVALLVFGLALAGRSLSSTLALLLIGRRAGDAVRSSVCLTPIGEFSLVIALVAVQAALVPDWFYALAIALCLLSTVATPVLIRRPEWFSVQFERLQPEFAVKAARFYHDWIESFRHRQRSSLFWKLTGPRWAQIVIQVLFISGLLILAPPAYRLAEKWLSPDWAGPVGLPALFWGAYLGLLIMPLVALWRMIEAVAMICAEAATRGRRHRTRLKSAFETLLRGAAYVAVLVWLSMFVPFEGLSRWGVLALLGTAVALAVLFWRKLVRWHSRFEIDLREHLQTSSFADPRGAGHRLEHPGQQWRLSAREHAVGEQTRAAGKSIRDLRLRQMFACTVVGIERQGFHLPNPAADTVLYPSDKLLLLGPGSELREAERWLGAPDSAGTRANGHPSLADLCLEQLTVPQDSRQIGKSLGELQPPQRLGVQIVGIERNDSERAIAGKFDIIQAGDRLLVLGTQQQIIEMGLWLAS